jgi:hypothetical protein
VPLPLVECFLDERYYFLTGGLPPPAGDELRPISRPRITGSPHRRARRAARRCVRRHRRRRTLFAVALRC